MTPLNKQPNNNNNNDKPTEAPDMNSPTAELGKYNTAYTTTTTTNPQWLQTRTHLEQN